MPGIHSPILPITISTMIISTVIGMTTYHSLTFRISGKTRVPEFTPLQDGAAEGRVKAREDPDPD